MLYEERIRYRLADIKEDLAKLEARHPDIKEDSLGAPAGQCDFFYKVDINKYTLQQGNLEINLALFKAFTGRNYEVSK